MEQLVVDHYAAPQDCQLGEVHGRVKCHMLGKMWTFWGGASAASYLLAPPQWQPSAAAAAAVLWSAYVSYRLHHPAPEEAEMANASAIDDYLREHRSDRYDVRAGAGDDGPTGSAVDRARDLLSVLSPGR